MKKAKLINSILLSVITLLIVSCSSREDFFGTLATDELETGDDVELVSPEDPGSGSDEVTILFSQDFESFTPDGNWFLSDFGLDVDSSKGEFVEGDKLNFSIEWTKRTRNHFADYLSVPRNEMTKASANSFCSPKIEIGLEKVYSDSDSENLIAELDTDTKRCGLTDNPSATVGIYSFIPTEIGYKYRLTVDYKMRNYSGQVDNSYKDLVVRFGAELEKFDPVFDDFQSAQVEMIAIGKYSKINLRDNGLPDGYGVLVDNIKVEYLGKVENYDSCAELFSKSSKGFKKCVQGEVSTADLCNFDEITSIAVNHKIGTGVSEDRKNTDNAFLDEGIVEGKINFLSLGLKGRAAISCSVDGYKGLFSIYQKTLSFQEVSWGGATPETYPELAKVRVKLEDCDVDSMNRVVTVGSIATAEKFSFTFEEDEDGVSFSGCKMSKLIIKDITPNGASVDGIDINSIKFE